MSRPRGKYTKPGKFRTTREKVQKVYNPTREQIQRECELIQATWLPAEREHRRCGGARIEWTLPVTSPVAGDRLARNESELAG